MPVRNVSTCSLLVAFLWMLQWTSRHVRCFALRSRSKGGLPLQQAQRLRRDPFRRFQQQQQQDPFRVLQQQPSSEAETGGEATVPAPDAETNSPVHHNEQEQQHPQHDEQELTESSPSSSSSSSSSSFSSESVMPGAWPCFDALDKRLIKIAVPMIAGFAINPLIGAVDLFWVNRMGNALAVAGQSAANQIFNSAFWVTSFLPSVTATLISKQNANKDEEGVQDAVCQALFVGSLVAMMSNVLVFSNPTKVLSSVLEAGAPAMEYARPYLLVRAFAFLPSMISLVGFSAFRGVLDTVTPVKISLFANIFNAILDPLLIFGAGMGVTGAAIATLTAEVISAICYLVLLSKRGMLNFSKLFRLPSWTKLEPLLKGGAALQMRNVAMNLTFLSVARVTQGIDKNGVAAAAHALAVQVFQLGGIVLLALSTVAQTVVPNDLVMKYDHLKKKTVGGKQIAKATVDRLMSWGLLLGIGLGMVQLLALPLIRQSTPLQEVRDAAKIPSILACIFQSMNGLVFIGEGIMIGTGNFLNLSINSVVATAGCLWALNTFPKIYGVTGIWMSFGVFNTLRLIGVALNQRVHGPLSPRKLRAESN